MAFNPGSGGGGGGSIAGSSDVSLSSPQDQQALTYQQSSSKWVNTDQSGLDESMLGQANGVASLNSSAKLPANQLSNPIYLVAEGSPYPSAPNGSILMVYNPNATLN